MPARSRSLLRRTPSARSSDEGLRGPQITGVETSVYKIPTDAPESDGTLQWDSTTLVLAEISAGGKTGLGYSYCSAAAAEIIGGKLAECLEGKSAFSIPRLWQEMVGAVRNVGWRGVAANAVSAVDIALWDLKAKLLESPLCELLGRAQDRVEVYGSGGFTSYDNSRLATQLGDWAKQQGCRAVKMKIGRDPDQDIARIKLAHSGIGKAQLFVDANGAYSRKQALHFAEAFADLGIGWFEEPVSSDDLEGLRLLRDRAPPVMDIAAGEYGYEHFYFRRMLEAGAVDVLQIDATRCCGYSGFLTAAAIANGFSTPVSSHCAPAIHLPVAAACTHLRHMEWFHDHVRIEHMLFEGAPEIRDGFISPDLQRVGHGLELKRADAERFRGAK
jgi:L-alanine-DL-glutamate epimerase-like enolase superfamily enzyme